MNQLTSDLKNYAQELGFVLAGVTAAAAPLRLAHFHRWLDNGFAGQMQYLENRRSAYDHPKHVLDGCKSIVMLALPYSSDTARQGNEAQSGGCAKVARYATGTDYHDVIHDKLRELKRWILKANPTALVRGVVDTAPLLEREIAEAAGLGWVGKNTLLLNRDWGSYFFLAAVLTDLELRQDPPNEKGYCGTCTACLSACPTKAFPEPYVLDANKCISYATIEHRGHVDLPPLDFNDWIFGCDICQEVCPWNRKIPVHAYEPDLEGDLSELDIIDTLALSDAAFRTRYRKTPLWRSKRTGLVRNAILLAGQRSLHETGPLLIRLLRDEEAVLRAAACWALARIKPPDWQSAVNSAIENELDAEVKSRFTQAIQGQ